jgi:hypothetical protein
MEDTMSQPELIGPALDANFCLRRSEVAQKILKAYKAYLAEAGLKIDCVESFDFSQGAYIGLMVMEGMLRGTDSEALKRLIQQVSEK